MASTGPGTLALVSCQRESPLLGGFVEVRRASAGGSVGLRGDVTWLAKYFCVAEVVAPVAPLMMNFKVSCSPAACHSYSPWILN